MARLTKFGTTGNNTLDARSGIYTLFGLAGNDLYLINASSDLVVEGANKGLDTVRTYDMASYTLPAHVENLSVWSTKIGAVFKGNALANRLDASQSGVNFHWETRVFGLGGNDALIGGGAEDWLDGGAGIDQMRGGKGDDTYVVDHGSDRIIEIDSFPIANRSDDDWVRSSVNYILPAQVENLQLTGLARANATGNAMNNELRGNAANNNIEGGQGYDAMYGGGGADRFIYRSIVDSGSNSLSDFVDHIYDFSSGSGDRIDLSHIDADPTLAGDQAFAFHAGDFTAAGQVRFRVLSNAVAIEINTDADEANEMTIKVVNGGTPADSWLVL